MSAARERAGRALYESGTHDFKWVGIGNILKESWRKESDIAHRASLDENDAALVEAVEQAVDAQIRHEGGQISLERVAIAAIIAARRHITGEGA